jgi:hypothetical protein
MKPRQALLVVVLCSLSVWHATMDAKGFELSHGRQIILNRGLQIQSQVFFTTPGFSDVSRWRSANFTTINFQWAAAPSLLGVMPVGTAWGRWAGLTTTLSSDERNYVNSFVSMQDNDEQEQTQQVQDAEKAFYASWHTTYQNALIYTNSSVGASGGFTTLAALKQYMQYTQPDMLCFDHYPGFSFSTSKRNTWYSNMQMYRTAGLAGYDDTGTSPIPYAQYLDLYRTSYSGATPSESFVRLQQNASWAFGYSMVSAFIYNTAEPSSGCYSVMFNQPATGQPNDSNPNTTVFNYVAETNRQSRNLGPALVRLVSTDIYMKPGSGKSVSGTGLSAWSAHAGNTTSYTDYLTGITPYTNSTANGGGIDSSYNDILVGYLKPLLANNPGCTFADGLHFMVVNGASQGTAADSSQWYHLTFDFTGSAFDELVRLSRDTGKVEAVPLTCTFDSYYYLDLNLPGGTGDLFTFWNHNNPLPTIPEPGTAALLASGLIGAASCVLRKRKGRH